MRGHVGALHCFQQRQRDGESGFSIGGAAPINAPIGDAPAEGVSFHLLDAHRIHVRIDGQPAIALAAPDGVDIGPARQNLLADHFSAQRGKPFRQLCRQARFARHAGARPGLLGRDAWNLHQLAQPMRQPCACNFDIQITPRFATLHERRCALVHLPRCNPTASYQV